MAWGVRIRNGSNIIQIDERYRNLQLIQKGSLLPDKTTADSGGHVYPMAYGTLSFSGLVNPVMVINCQDPAYYSGANPAGGQHSFDLFRPKANSSPIYWWLFDDVKPAVATPGWGMRVRNPATNQVVYDSRIPPFRVVDNIAPFDMPVSEATNTDFTYAAGKTYGFTCARMAERWSVAGSSTISAQRQLSACQAITNGLRVRWQTQEGYVGPVSGAPVVTAFTSFKNSWIVVDVTNL